MVEHGGKLLALAGGPTYELTPDLATVGPWDFDGGLPRRCAHPKIDPPTGEGYYVTFRTDRETLESDFVILAADDIASGPIARVPLPHCVPAGLDGKWFAGL